jgi:phage shock protein E
MGEEANVSGIPSMRMGELRERFGSRLPADELILDVREADEFAEGHVPGARNIPHEEVAGHLDELRGFRRVYVHCGGGGRAGKAAETLGRAGLKNVVHVRESGFRWWRDEGLPVER